MRDDMRPVSFVGLDWSRHFAENISQFTNRIAVCISHGVGLLPRPNPVPKQKHGSSPSWPIECPRSLLSKDYIFLAWPGWISAGGAVLAPVVVNLREAIAESCIRRHPHFSVTGNKEGCVT
ncbi:uncharacterized [Tachysurus ichikawai]